MCWVDATGANNVTEADKLFDIFIGFFWVRVENGMFKLRIGVQYTEYFLKSWKFTIDLPCN